MNFTEQFINDYNLSANSTELTLTQQMYILEQESD